MRKKLALKQLRIRYFLYFLSGFLIVFLTAVILIYWQTDKKTQTAVVAQSQAKQLTLTHAGALAIKNFFKERKSELLLLSQNESVKSLQESGGRKALESLAQQAKERDDLTLSLGRVDREGMIIWDANTRDIRGVDDIFVGDHDYFSWAKQAQENEVFISDPFIARGGVNKDRFVILIAAPVFNNNQFNGLVFIGFAVEEIIQKFVLPLASSSQTKVILVSEKGEVIGSNLAGQAKKNIIDCLGPREKESGSLIHDCHLDPKDDIVKTVITYTKIKPNGNLWILFIGVPYKEIVSPLWPLRVIQTGGLFLILGGSFALSLIFILTLRVIEGKSFINGFNHAHKAKRKRKKK